MKKALVIIGAQKGFVNNKTVKTVNLIKNFIEKNKNSYALVVFTKYVNHEGSAFVKNLDWRGFMSKKETDITPLLKNFANSKNTFTKDTYSSFINNELSNVLKQYKIGQVELAGFDTENCVLTFARDAFDRGMSVVVHRNLVASHSNHKLHQAALEIIRDNIGNIK